MSDDGRLSLLRLRALARRLAVPVSARFARVETGIEGLVGTDGSLPLVGADPLGGLGELPQTPFVDPGPIDRHETAPNAAGKAAHSSAEQPGLVGAAKSPPARLGEPGRKEAGAFGGSAALGNRARSEAISPGGMVFTSSSPAEAEHPIFRLGGQRGGWQAIETARPPGARGPTVPEVVDGHRGQVVAEGPRGPGLPPDIDSVPVVANRATTIPSSFSWPTPALEPPLPSQEEPVGLGLVVSLLARIDSNGAFSSAEPSSPGTAPAGRKSFEAPLPAPKREPPTPPIAGSAPARARAAAEGAGEGAGSAFRAPPPPDRAILPSWLTTSPAAFAGSEPSGGIRQNRGRLSPAFGVSPPSASRGEPVGLGLVAGLLARIDSNGAPSSTRRGTTAAPRPAFGSPRSGQNQQQPSLPRQAQPPGKQAAPTADQGVLPSAPFVERPSPQSPAAEPSFASEDRRVPLPPILPRNAEQDAPAPAAKAAATAATTAAVSPFETARAATSALDPDLLADLVNDALVAQAARSGVDLS